LTASKTVLRPERDARFIHTNWNAARPDWLPSAVAAAIVIGIVGYLIYLRLGRD
jgi:hypothetical protein